MDPSDSESEQESVTNSEAEEKTQPRTGWIYTLKKQELLDELQKFGLQSLGNVRANRRLLSSFIKGGYPPTAPKSSTAKEPAPGASTQEHNRSVSNKTNDGLSICNTVRKWNLTYDGDKDVVLFLERLNELKEAYNLGEEEMLLALPELLKGKALLWYRNSKSLWPTWDVFIAYFETQFLPRRYRENLDLQIRARTQGPDERFSDFVIAIQTLMRRHGKYSKEQQFNQIYENMLPEYKLYGVRQNIKSLPELMKAALEYEAIVQSAKSYRPPINAAQAMYPETAFNNRKNLPRPSNSRPQVNERNNGSHRNSPRGNLNPPRDTQGDVRPKCWNCDKPGHLFRDCRLPKKPAPCRFCGAEERSGSCTCSGAVNYRGGWRRGGPSSPRN